ncbi:MAG: Hpt domain-containing protein [Amylibacter sp.]|nr:Hpt domain-containing protein [Amylibacter sp.]
MTQGAKNALQDQLKVVRERFISLLDERLDELEVLREHIDQGKNREEALKKIQFIVHKISGTAGTLGFPETGKLAARAEDAIIRTLASGGEQPTFEDTIKLVDVFHENALDVSSSYYWN